MEENKYCYNCKYFMQHYVMTNRGFKKTHYGHCMKRISAKGLKIFPYDNKCDKWGSSITFKEERQSDLCKDLKRMAKEIHNIYCMVKTCQQDEIQ